MAIITISRGCFSHGTEIAQKVADRLDYKCVSNQFLFEASKYFNIPEMQLLKSLHDPPSFFERLTHGKDTFLAYIRAALLEQVKNDNVVYHGYAGHLLLSDIPGVLKVRVLARMEERIHMVRHLKGISRQDATKQIQEEDSQRSRWTRAIYKEDITYSPLYDVVVQIGALTIEDACDIICQAAQSEAYKTSETDRRSISDLAIASHAKAILQSYSPTKITSDGGNVHIVVPPQKIKKADYITPQAATHLKERFHDDLVQEIVDLVQKIPDVKQIACDIDMPRYS
jgi:cytidylate kinase